MVKNLALAALGAALLSGYASAQDARTVITNAQTALGLDSDLTQTPGVVTAPGRPRNKDSAPRAGGQARSQRTLLDEPSPFGSELPPWVTPWVMAAVGAGLVLLGFLLGRLIQ